MPRHAQSTAPLMSALKRRRVRGGTTLRVVVGLSVLGVAGVGYWLSDRPDTSLVDSTAKGLTRAAFEGPLTVSLVEKGKITALNPVVLTCQIEGRTRLIEILPEGTQVKAGDIVAKFDSSALENKRIDLEIRVENARAETVKERQDLAITKNQAEADIAKATLDLELAELDLNKYWSGEFPNDLLASKNRISLSLAEHKQAEDRLDGSKQLLNKNYISETEYESDELKEQRASNEVEKAVEDLRLLRKYNRVRDLRQMLSDIEQKKLTLDRVTRRAEANIIQAEAQLRADDGNYLRQSQLLKEVIEQLEYCVIRAPSAGPIVYAPPRSRRDPPLEAGQDIVENQALIYLPSEDTDNAMMLSTAIHETYLDRVRMGQPAQITVDSLPGKLYKGYVAFIASHPNKQESWLNPDLVIYDTHIYFDGAAEGLRAGMTGRVEILVDHFENVVQVPVQAVVTRDGQKVVFVVDETTNEQEPVPVEIGMDNEINVVIASGVEAGQIISLVPPLEPGTEQSTATSGREWTNDAVVQARDARTKQDAAADLSGSLAKLTNEQKLVIDALKKADNDNTLEVFLPNIELQEQALTVLSIVEDGQSPAIGQELRQAVETKVVIEALKTAQTRGFMDRFVNNDTLKEEAEVALVQAADGQTPQLSPLLTRTVLTKLLQRYNNPEGGQRREGGSGGWPRRS